MISQACRCTTDGFPGPDLHVMGILAQGPRVVAVWGKDESFDVPTPRSEFVLCMLQQHG